MRKIITAAVALLAIVSIAFVVGCGGETKTETTTDNTNTQTQEPVYITIKGSDTMVHLVTNWAEAYMKTNTNYQITVNGGGSGTGISALINGTTDVAASSREMKSKEMDEAKAAGNEPVENLVGLDGIAIAVHPENPIAELTMAQLKDIFTGKKTNWKDFGGPDSQISIYSRESSSGTYQFFQEHVLSKENYAATAKLMPATSAIVEGCASEKTAIGYIGLGYAAEAGSKIKVIAVKADDASPAVMATEATVKDKTYAIARGLYLYSKSSSPEAVKSFLSFCISAEGQKILTETGYITIQ